MAVAEVCGFLILCLLLTFCHRSFIALPVNHITMSAKGPGEIQSHDGELLSRQDKTTLPRDLPAPLAALADTNRSFSTQHQARI